MNDRSVDATRLAHKRNRTAKLCFFLAAVLSFLFSITLYFYVGNKQAGLYVGLWVPSILSAGTLLLMGD